MKYATPEAFRAALDQRIRNKAAISGVPVMRLRKRVAFERFLAEKVHAYTATYGPQEQPSTRIKDLTDLLLIADLATPRADHLRDSLDGTFRNRARQSLPSALPAPPPSWTTPYARAAEEVGLPTNLDTAHTDAVAFLDPVLAGAATGCWNPTQKRWTAS